MINKLYDFSNKNSNEYKELFGDGKQAFTP